MLLAKFFLKSISSQEYCETRWWTGSVFLRIKWLVSQTKSVWRQACLPSYCFHCQWYLENLKDQFRATAAACKTVAQGDLSRKIERKCKIPELTNTTNMLADLSNSFAFEVIRVARRLEQKETWVWKPGSRMWAWQEITSNVYTMTSYPTTQMRASGELSAASQASGQMNVLKQRLTRRLASWGMLFEGTISQGKLLKWSIDWRASFRLYGYRYLSRQVESRFRCCRIKQTEP